MLIHDDIVKKIFVMFGCVLDLDVEFCIFLEGN